MCEISDAGARFDCRHRCVDLASRGHQTAIDTVHSLGQLNLSVVSYVELIQGSRNKRELNGIRKASGILNARVLQIDDSISTKAMFFVEQYTLSQSMEMADALIGATAVVRQRPLLTGNDR